MCLKVANLKVELKKNPLGIEARNPGLSWVPVSNKRNVFQSAYQIICARNQPDLEHEKNLLWDSKKIETDRSTHIVYHGESLRSGQKVFWKVRIWDNTGRVSEWSDPSYWQMGLLDHSDWKAEWIESTIEEDTADSTPCQYFRKEFHIDHKISSATIYITCRGLYELRINGRKISDEYFTPGWTSYHHRLQYQSFDVTDELNDNDNCLGIIMGDGWYRGYLVWQGERQFYGDKLALLCQLEISYENGTKELITSGTDWKSSTGPIQRSDIYNGELYDARLEQDGWDTPGFNESSWLPVVSKDYGYDILVGSEGVPVRITETLRPVEKIITPKGETVFDFGQNFVGWIKFRLKGRRGYKITIQHAEVLDQEGNFYTENLRGVKALDSYIFKNDREVTFEPHFTFHGFRYIKISDFKDDISIDNLEGRVVHSDMTPIGGFECSDELINRLQKNIEWSLRGNFLDIPTDCPQRDERLGWTGDAQVFAPTACFNMDTAAFFRKWMKDFIVDQKKDGSVPWVVPNVLPDAGGTGWSDGFGAIGWADAAVIIPWQVYMAYGDKQILKDQYGSMKAWVEYLITEYRKEELFSSVFHFGDWLSFAEYYSYYFNAPDYGFAGANTDKELIATAYFYYSATLMQKTAKIVGNDNDAKKYADLLPEIKNTFCKEFLTQSGRLTSNTQTAYILALSFGLLPDEMIEEGAKRLVRDVNHFGHLTTGFLGTPLICQALTENGYPDMAYKLLFNKRYPSWLFPVTQGATTIWERWDGIRHDGTFQSSGMNSFNHYAYGAVGNWLYTSVAGIKTDPEVPGYKRIIIKPHLTDELTYAKAWHHSMYGEIISHWEIIDKEVSLQLLIPPNTSAKVFIPCTRLNEITADLQPLKTHQDLLRVETETEYTVVTTGSGKYNFKFPTPFS